MRRLGFALAAAGLAFSAHAQTAPAAPASLNDAEKMQANIRNWAFRWTAADKPTLSSSGKPDGQRESMVGREDTFAGTEPADETPDCISLPVDAMSLIRERARLTNIVIIGEAHNAPLDRHFIGEVLTMLRVEGYAIYAAETFSPYVDLDHDDVLGTDGWYTNEPVYARTVRLARSLGYRLVAYEQTAQQSEAAEKAPGKTELSSINAREADEAENLMAAIFRGHPDEKVVIHVGYGHVLDGEDVNGKGWIAMASRLKAMSGRDPLSISQTDCRSAGAGEVIAERRHAPKARPDDAAVPVDLMVGRPPLKLKDGRPAWRQEAGDRTARIPATFLTLKEPVIVEARPQGSPLATVPVDRVMLFPGETRPLLLPPGRYRVDGFVKAGRLEGEPVVIEVPR